MRETLSLKKVLTYGKLWQIFKCIQGRVIYGLTQSLKINSIFHLGFVTTPQDTDPQNKFTTRCVVLVYSYRFILVLET